LKKAGLLFFKYVCSTTIDQEKAFQTEQSRRKQVFISNELKKTKQPAWAFILKQNSKIEMFRYSVAGLKALAVG
jgi:hypothetical protein